jgi:hypothetical protein
MDGRNPNPKPKHRMPIGIGAGINPTPTNMLLERWVTIILATIAVRLVRRRRHRRHGFGSMQNKK